MNPLFFNVVIVTCWSTNPSLGASSVETVYLDFSFERVISLVIELSSFSILVGQVDLGFFIKIIIPWKVICDWPSWTFIHFWFILCVNINSISVALHYLIKLLSVLIAFSNVQLQVGDFSSNDFRHLQPLYLKQNTVSKEESSVDPHYSILVPWHWVLIALTQTYLSRLQW